MSKIIESHGPMIVEIDKKDHVKQARAIADMHIDALISIAERVSAERTRKKIIEIIDQSKYPSSDDVRDLISDIKSMEL